MNIRSREILWLTVNGLTALRGLLALESILLAERSQFNLSLPLALTAALMDMIDGALARKWHVTSELGAYSDAIADGAFLAAFAANAVHAAYEINALGLHDAFTDDRALLTIPVAALGISFGFFRFSSEYRRRHPS